LIEFAPPRQLNRWVCILFMNDQIDVPGTLVFLGDFKHARKFAWHILRGKFHTRNRTDLRYWTHLAFNTALIVAYGRPFFSNRGFGNAASSLKSYVSTVLTDPDDVALHDKIISLRKTAYAHSDASSHLLPGLNYNGNGIKFTRDAFVLLNESETQRVKAMAQLWVKFLETQRSKLRAPVS
jgi:hypothetical protein